jgi:hypothetical protein
VRYSSLFLRSVCCFNQVAVDLFLGFLWREVQIGLESGRVWRLDREGWRFFVERGTFFFCRFNRFDGADE